MNPTNNGQTKPIEFIQTQPPFDYLSEAELKLIEQNLQSVHFSAGTRIYGTDSRPSRYLYVIYQGVIRLMRDGQTVRVLEEGELFGYMSMLNQNSPAYEVVADEEILAYQIPEAVFRRLIDNADFAEFFLKDLSERLRQARPETSPVTGDLTTPVGSLTLRPPLIVSPAATVAEVAQAMTTAWVDSAIVMDQPLGIVTDRDFRVRVLAEEMGPQTPVRMVMTRPLKMVTVETPVYAALLYMLEENMHHLALMQEGELAGVVTAGDLLRHQAKSPLYLLRQLETLESPVDLTQYSLEIAGTVDILFKGGLGIAQIGRAIASLNDALTRRLLKLAENELGPPPTPYAWIVFGSEGRMEQALLTDQDNALIYQEDTPETKKYFSRLADRVVNGLLQAGFPPCPGGYMASNWYRPFNEMLNLFQKWINTPNPKALLESAIFFDFRPVHGDLSLEPLEKIVSESGNENIFLAHLAAAALEFRPPLGFFRRIKQDEAGKVDLKPGGVAPVVSLARVYALEAGARTRSTFERLEAAAEAGTLSWEGAETLAETYRFLLQLRLREQLAAVNQGASPTNSIHLSALSPLEHRHLKDAFMAIREMQDATAQRFQTGLLG